MIDELASYLSGFVCLLALFCLFFSYLKEFLHTHSFIYPSILLSIYSFIKHFSYYCWW